MLISAIAEGQLKELPLRHTNDPKVRVILRTTDPDSLFSRTRGEWTNQHLMSVNGRFRDISADDLLAEADRFGLGEGKGILAQVRAALLRWREVATAAGIAATEIDRIGALHRPL